HPLLELMPPLLVVRGAGQKDPTLRIFLETMATELREQRLGAATVMTRLADVVLARVLRSWVESRADDATGWLGAVREPPVGRALAAVHRRPGDPWSVARLAGAARMSRSVFFEKFTAVVGVTPARYLSRWRMHLASAWLRRDRLSVAETAARLGYDS